MLKSLHHHISSGKKGSAVEHAKYISRQGKHDNREDIVCTWHGNMPEWALNNPLAFWGAADKHERANGAAYCEHEIALPNELPREQQMSLVKELVVTLIGDKPYQCAIHAPRSALEGVTNTHVHVMSSNRKPDGIERSPEQTFRRHNAKHPERGGCKKDSGGKNRSELRNDVIELRRKCAALQNAALERHGHATRIDHRSLREQGISRAPERHLGQAGIRKMSSEEKERYVASRLNRSQSA